GYICASGFNIVTTTKVKGRTIGTIVLGESSGKVRTAKVRKVLGKALKSPSKKGLNVSSFGQRQESPAMDLRVKICGQRAAPKRAQPTHVSYLKVIPLPEPRPDVRPEKVKRF